MSLPPRVAAEDWSAEIAEDVLAEANGAILIVDPDDSVTTPYDPVTDAGGETSYAVIMPERPARIQSIKAPAEYSTDNQWATKQFFRIQVELRDADPLIHKGLILRVTDGGKDATLERFAYTVLAAVNSSHAALRTIMCVSDLADSPAVT